MLRVLSKEEYEVSRANKNGEVQKWWNELSERDKNKLFELNHELYKQANCVHEWAHTTMYDEKYEYCKNCNIRKEDKGLIR
jgi:predicted metal-binding protein